MSLASWKREFYKIEARNVPRERALRHSLIKWQGLLKQNRQKHKVHLYSGDLFDDKNYDRLAIGGDTCALCYEYQDTKGCNDCPLRSCEKAYQQMMDHNRVTPMINKLKNAIKRGKDDN